MDPKYTYKLDSDVDEDEADHGRSPVTINYGEYVHEWTGAGQTDHVPPSNSIQPEVASPDHAAMIMSDAQNWSNMMYWERFARTGGEGLYSTPVYPRPPLSELDNPVIDGMLNGNQMVNLTTNVDRPTNIDPRLLDTSSNLLELGPVIPSQSVSQPFTVGHELVAHQTGPDTPALSFGMEPQLERLPPAEQDGRAGAPSAPLIAHAFSMPVDASHDHASCDGGLTQQPAVEAQPSEANTDQEVPFQCGICGNLCRDLPSLRRHCDTHTEKVNRYVCIAGGCTQASRYLKDWMRHLVTHYKFLIIPSFCEEPDCPKGDHPYPRHDHLLRHIRTKHPESDAAERMRKAAANKPSRIKQPSSSGRMPKKLAEKPSKACATKTASKSQGAQGLLSREPSSRNGKTPGKKASKWGAAKRMSKSRGTQSPLGREPSAEPAARYQQSLPSYEGSRMLDSVCASTSNSTSVFTPDAAESMFTEPSARPAMQDQQSLFADEVSQTVENVSAIPRDSSLGFTPEAEESMFTFGDAEYSPSPSSGPQSFFSAPRK